MAWHARSSCMENVHRSSSNQHLDSALYCDWAWYRSHNWIERVSRVSLSRGTYLLFSSHGTLEDIHTLLVIVVTDSLSLALKHCIVSPFFLLLSLVITVLLRVNSN